MTREGILKHQELFNEWLRGKDIQHYHETLKQWVDTDYPNWLENINYRVKPEEDWRLNFEDLEGFEVIHDGGLLNFDDLPIETQREYLDNFKKGDYMSILPTKEEADAYRVLPMLLYWRNKYNKGWIPDWTTNEPKHVIYFDGGTLYADTGYYTSYVLNFKSSEVRDKFMEDFKDLLEIVKPLL